MRRGSRPRQLWCPRDTRGWRLRLGAGGVEQWLDAMGGVWDVVAASRPADLVIRYERHPLARPLRLRRSRGAEDGAA